MSNDKCQKSKVKSQKSKVKSQKSCQISRSLEIPKKSFEISNYLVLQSGCEDWASASIMCWFSVFFCPRPQLCGLCISAPSNTSLLFTCQHCTDSRNNFLGKFIWKLSGSGEGQSCIDMKATPSWSWIPLKGFLPWMSIETICWVAALHSSGSPTHTFKSVGESE